MWIVQLVGAKGDLDDLAKSLNGEYFDVSRESGDFVLYSNHFEPADDAQIVKQKAVKIATFLSAGCRLTLGSHDPIEVRSVYRYDQDGERHITIFPESCIHQHRARSPSFKTTLSDGTVKEAHPADPLVKWLPLAMTNERVANVFQILEKGTLDWVNLYRIYEIIAQDVGGMREITSPGWATKASLELFRRTANSPGAIGLEARHGAESTQSPANPMAINEARKLINSIIRAWLRSKE